MSILEGLRFKPGHSFVHRLDPRAKLLTSVLILATAALFIDPVVISILLVLEAILIRWAEVGKLWLKTLRGAVPLVALVFVVSLVTNYFPTGSLDPVTPFSNAYRLLVFLSSFSLFFLTTTPEEIGLTLTKMRVPYQYTFAFVSAVRFTPVLAEEMRTIMDAQRARGLELDRGRLLQRVRRLIPILIPLLVNVLRRSYELAEAMEVKCFGASRRRTYLRELRATARDYAFTTIVLLLFSAAVYARAIGLEPFRTMVLTG